MPHSTWAKDVYFIFFHYGRDEELQLGWEGRVWHSAIQVEASLDRATSLSVVLKRRSVKEYLLV